VASTIGRNTQFETQIVVHSSPPLPAEEVVEEVDEVFDVDEILRSYNWISQWRIFDIKDKKEPMDSDILDCCSTDISKGYWAWKRWIDYWKSEHNNYQITKSSLTFWYGNSTSNKLSSQLKTSAEWTKAADRLKDWNNEGRKGLRLDITSTASLWQSAAAPATAARKTPSRTSTEGLLSQRANELSDRTEGSISAQLIKKWACTHPSCNNRVSCYVVPNTRLDNGASNHLPLHPEPLKAWCKEIKENDGSYKAPSKEVLIQLYQNRDKGRNRLEAGAPTSLRKRTAEQAGFSSGGINFAPVFNGLSSGSNNATLVTQPPILPPPSSPVQLLSSSQANPDNERALLFEYLLKDRYFKSRPEGVKLMQEVFVEDKDLAIQAMVRYSPEQWQETGLKEGWRIELRGAVKRWLLRRNIEGVD
jgi:hypothetical protein